MPLTFILSITTTWLVAGAQVYPSLPEANLTAIMTRKPPDSLAALFNGARGFVTIVFAPFPEMTAEISKFLTVGDTSSVLVDNWRRMLNIQSAVISCVVFGVLYIVIDIVFGIILCACYCPCWSCIKNDAEPLDMKPRVKRSAILLICANLIFVPGIISLQTNQLIKNVLPEISSETASAIQNGINYVENIQVQLEVVADQYQVMADIVTGKIDNVSSFLSTAVENDFRAVQDPVLSKYSQLGRDTNILAASLSDYEANRVTLVAAQQLYMTQLSDFKANFTARLSGVACTTDQSCNETLTIISEIDSVLFDFSSVDNKNLNSTFLQNYSSTCGAAFTALESAVMASVNSDVTTSISVSASSLAGVRSGINSTRATLNGVISGLDMFPQFSAQLVSARSMIQNFVTSYINSFDKYRYGVGVLLGLIVVEVAILFIGGVIIGFCFHSKGPPSPMTKLASIALAIGVGLSVIFSWLIMILVTITFLVGGFSERYVCQTTESPYELLQFVDTYFPLLSPGGSSLSISLVALVTSCRENAGIVGAMNLSDQLNISSMYSGLQREMSSVSIPISIPITASTMTYSSFLESCLTTILDSGVLRNISLEEGMSLPSLNAAADSLASRASNVPLVYRSIVLEASVALNVIEDSINPTRLDLDSLVSSVQDHNRTVSLVKSLAENLKTSAPAADAEIARRLPNITSQAVNTFVQNILDDVTLFAKWVNPQVRYGLGACLPVFEMYKGLVVIFCDQVVDPLNGFWFSLGWSIFFMIPSVVIALNLAEFYKALHTEKVEPEKPKSLINTIDPAIQE